MWRSQTFENTYQGGYMLVLPYELLPLWVGNLERDEPYADLCQFAPGPVDFLPIGNQFGVFVAGPEGDIIHEAWWLREDPQGPVVLAAWNEWDLEIRESWLSAQLARPDLEWQRHTEPLVLESGVLVLLHAEGVATDAQLASPERTAVCGEYVTVELAPGVYAVETTEIEERPEGAHCVELCRFIAITSEV